MVCSNSSLDLADSGSRSAQPGAESSAPRTVVCLAGEQDLATVAGLAGRLQAATSVDSADLVVDLSQVTFIDAATINELVRARNVLQREHRSLRLRLPSKCATRVLDLCGLNGLVEPA